MPIELLINKFKIIKLFIKKIVLSKQLKLDILIKNKNFIEYIYLLKFLFYFTLLIDIIGADWPNKINRFQIIYNFLNVYSNNRLYSSIEISEQTAYFVDVNNSKMNESFVFSIVSIYQGANWLERETWDMFGILFFGHPDLRRILTDYGFEGFPLRKDFPLTGFLELRYDEEQKTILYEKVELSQEFRFFDFESPWKQHQ